MSKVKLEGFILRKEVIQLGSQEVLKLSLMTGDGVKEVRSINQNLVDVYRHGDVPNEKVEIEVKTENGIDFCNFITRSSDAGMFRRQAGE